MHLMSERSPGMFPRGLSVGRLRREKPSNRTGYWTPPGVLSPGCANKVSTSYEHSDESTSSRGMVW
jgi:hypothetical protein